MADDTQPTATPTDKLGHVVWMDLTAPDAEGLKDFYAAVVGWTATGVDMGGYQDFVMTAPSKAGQLEGAVGVCHTRGSNAEIPAMWVPYFAVADLDKAVSTATSMGGTMIGDIRAFGDSRFAIMKDPEGVAFGLAQ